MFIEWLFDSRYQIQIIIRQSVGLLSLQWCVTFKRKALVNLQGNRGDDDSHRLTILWHQLYVVCLASPLSLLFLGSFSRKMNNLIFYCPSQLFFMIFFSFTVILLYHIQICLHSTEGWASVWMQLFFRF